MTNDTDKTYLNNDYSIMSWLFAVDHKRIALLYLVSILLFFVLGGAAALLLRMELLSPEADTLSNAAFKRFYTIHGFLMVFFGLLPAIPAVLGNFMVPLMIGARNLAFPRLNLGSWHLFFVAGLLMIAGSIAGGVDTGWVFYAPYGDTAIGAPVLLTGLGLMLVSASSILVAVNFIATIHKMRAPGMVWDRLPLFVWTIYVTSLVMLVGTPLLIVTVILVVTENLLHWGIFNPQMGGDPILFQHLFWFYGNQIAFVIVLPAIGIICEIFAAFSQRRIFGYKAVVYAIWAIALLGFTTWPIHLVNTNISAFVAFVASFFAFLTIAPFTVIIFSLIATLYKAELKFDSPMLFALGGLVLLLMGGITKAFLSTLILARHLQGTYFETAHWHFVVTGAVMAVLGGLHFWWPKITGRNYAEGVAKTTAILFFLAIHLTLLPQLILGYMGMPRHAQWYPAEFTVLQVAASLGVSLLAVAYVLPLLYLVASLFGKRVATNPWQACGLEWQVVSSPPTPNNFEVTPLVTDDAYAYPDGSENNFQTPHMPMPTPSR